MQCKIGLRVFVGIGYEKKTDQIQTKEFDWTMAKMQKHNQPLKLQSYKIDTSQLQSKIHELDELKSDLRSSLARQREQEDSFMSQIRELELQNQKLRDHIKGLQLTVTSQKTLIQQLQKKLTKTEDLMYQYQEQVVEQTQKRKEIQQEYQMQVDYLQREKQKMKREVEERHMKTSNVVEIDNGRQFNQVMFRASQQSLPESEQSSGSESKKIKRLKKNNKEEKKEEVTRQESFMPLGVKEKYRMENPIVEGEDQSQLTAEDIYLEMIRHLYKQLAKIELKAKDISKIPMVGSFSGLKHPTRNDFGRLLASHPFQLSQRHKADAVYLFLTHQLERHHREVSGSEIVREIACSLEEIESDKELSLMSSCFNDSELQTSQLTNTGFRRVSKPFTATAEEQLLGFSKETIPQLSEASQYQ